MHTTPPPTSFLVISSLSLMTNTIQEGRRWAIFGQKTRPRVAELVSVAQRRGCEEEGKPQSHFLLFLKSSGGCMWVLLDKRLKPLVCMIVPAWNPSDSRGRGRSSRSTCTAQCPPLSKKRRRRVMRKRRKMNKIRRKRRRKKQQQQIQSEGGGGNSVNTK